MKTNTSVSLGDSRPLAAYRGFTLIELMITVAIVAILATIATTSYSKYALKAHRTEAKTALLDIASLEERYFSVNNAYTGDPTQLGYTGTAGATFNVGSGYYNVLVTPFTATAPSATSPGGVPASYSLVATAIGTQLPDTECYQFTLTSNGVQSSVNSALATTTDCWS